MKFNNLKSFYCLLVAVLILISFGQSKKISQPLKHFNLHTSLELFKEIGHSTLKVTNQKSINVFDGCLQFFVEKLDQYFNVFRTFWEKMKDFRKGKVEFSVEELKIVMNNLQGKSFRYNNKDKVCTNVKFITNNEAVLNILNQDKYFGKRYDRTKIYNESALRKRKNLPAEAFRNIANYNQWENPTLNPVPQNYGSPVSNV